MDEQLEMRAEITMLMHVTAALWGNYIANSGGDTIATCRRVARESLDNIEGIYERLKDPNPGLHPTVQTILHHEEGFWQMVEEQVAAHRRS